MLVQHFMRIPEFAQVPPQELRALAARSHILCVPGKRWLLREGMRMDAYFYLLKGCVETHTPRRKLRASSFGRLGHFYPGCAAVRTLGNVQVLRVDGSHREFILQGGSLPAVMTSHAELWLKRFLSSHMMRQLSAKQWQDFLSAFQPYDFAPGSRILRHGQPGRHCFVLESGHAIVHRGNVTLSHLCPGDFFGEDALVLGSVRNADVSALENVRVHAIERDVFTTVLVNNLVQFVSHAGCGQFLYLHEGTVGQCVSLANIRECANRLDPRYPYYVGGGTRSERALVVLILIQRGFRAHALEERRT
jgi:CRP-like cAMP-binding protein